MGEPMDIRSLSIRTGLGERRLRYVIEYEILPPLHGFRPGRGKAREFGDLEAFCIALAATLLEMGLRRGAARDVMATALEFSKPGLSPGAVIAPVLQNAYGFAKRSVLEIDEAGNVRIESTPRHLKTGKNTVQAMSMPWTQPASGARLPEDHEPMAVIGVRIDKLAQQVRGV